jgi:hypothetical protein
MSSGAVIIPFPGRAAPHGAALHALAQAGEERRAALVQWRAAMADLALGLAALSHALECCRESLAELQALGAPAAAEPGSQAIF